MTCHGVNIEHTECVSDLNKLSLVRIGYSGLVLVLRQFLHCPSCFKKMMLASKVVKIDSKIIINLNLCHTLKTKKGKLWAFATNWDVNECQSSIYDWQLKIAKKNVAFYVINEDKLDIDFGFLSCCFFVFFRHFSKWDFATSSLL